MNYGVPQGAVLSPTLYNIYTYDVTKHIGHCNIGLFADDTCIYYSSKFLDPITNNLIYSYEKLQKYFIKWKININTEKTNAIYFTRRRKKEIPRTPLIIQQQHIPWSNNIKYLGVILDKKLTLNEHLKEMAMKTNKIVRILYSLLNKNSEMNQTNKLLIYKQIIRPAMCYASPIISTAAKTNINQLQRIQNKIIKMCLNVPWFTSTNHIHEITKIDKIVDFNNKNYLKFIEKIQH
jgi:hypothetical protein